VEQVEQVQLHLSQAHLLQEQVAEVVVGILVLQVLRGQQQVAQVVEELVEDMLLMPLQHQHIHHGQ
tara:strand:- start:125 stop:322 length:198 start_codon:yes stop_codon:yes gene_type:complete